MMKKGKIFWLRHTLLWSVVILLVVFLAGFFTKEQPDPELYCPFGGLQALASYCISGSLACSMTIYQLVMGIVLALTVLFFSKLFCSFLCPMGLLSEYLTKAREYIKIKAITIKNGSAVDKALRLIKYILLFTVFYFTLSSSELFCKQFDPYYAFATGLTGELSVWLALVAIYILFLGSFFIKMFWCKYICPLGALSNIFRFITLFVSLLLIYLVPAYFGINLHWVYLLAATTLFSYVLEITYNESKIFPLLKIFRDNDSCTNCDDCQKACPYSIDIKQSTCVKQVDCNLCCECIHACKAGALSVNKKRGIPKFIPLLVIILFGVALFFGSIWELPMLSERWADKAIHAELTELEIKGLRSNNCVGSSKTFVDKLKGIEGVYGAKTYLNEYKVKILYNPNEISREEIEQSIFTPTKFKISIPPQGTTKVKKISIRTENMFDKMDPGYLGLQLRFAERGFYGLVSKYGSPLIIDLYMNIDEPVDEELIKNIVEKKEISIPVHGKSSKKIKVDFKYISLDPNVDTVTLRQYLEAQFTPYSSRYKTNIKKFGTKNEQMYEIDYPNLDNPAFVKNIPYLSSFLSLQDGFLGINTCLNDKDTPCIQLFYAKDVLDEDKIWEILNRDSWQIKLKNGTFKTVDSKMAFEEKGVVKIITGEN